MRTAMTIWASGDARPLSDLVDEAFIHLATGLANPDHPSSEDSR